MRGAPAIQAHGLRDSRRTGFSLIELSMVLVVAALVIAAAILFFSGVSVEDKTKETVEELVQVDNVVHNVFTGQQDYSALTMASVINSHQLPAKWTASTTSLGTPFGGTITIAPDSWVTLFDVALWTVPKQICIALASRDWVYGQTVSAMYVNYGSAITNPLTPAQAEAACNSPTQNSVTLVFY